MAEKNINISELDFDTIKTNLKRFLKDQSEFSDYNFEGSGLSVLLDVLAYNTHYMGYYLNMVANEMFIDTAQLRESVVSHAKLLGYTPMSRIASQATINVSFQEVSGGSNSAITMPRFTQFGSASKDGITYTFVNVEQKTATKNNQGFFNFTNVKIKEGNPASFTFVYDSQTNPKQLFVLPDAGIDTTTLLVQVQKSSRNANLETFVLAQDATEVDSTAPVYYLEQNREGKYQIYFGDDVIGKKLSEGNIIIVSYITTSGDAANGIKKFKMIGTLLNTVIPTITLVNESSDGKLEESIEKIRFTAPKSFIAQNRAVTKNDYISLINKNYPYFDAVTVWGGEEAVPPVYGKIFFSIKPRGNYEITETEIDYIKKEIIQPVSVLTVTPEYVAPDYNYLNLVVDVVYDPRKTTKSIGEIRTAVKTAIENFSDEYLNSFNNTLKLSRMIRAIDDSDPSIENNSVKLLLEKRFRPTLGQSKGYKLDFNVEIKRGTVNDRVYSEPSFEHLDEFGVLRTCFIEEVPLSFSGIDEVEIVSAGDGYTEIPSIVIEGDGEGAIAEAVIVNGKLKSVIVTRSGSNYSAAVARVVGGGGSGAEIKPVLQGKKGNLRLYYFDTNNVKRVINPNVGTVFYLDGVIELNNFMPETIADAFGTLVFKASPSTTTFSSDRNSIITLDKTDPAAIQINISQVTS